MGLCMGSGEMSCSLAAPLCTTVTLARGKAMGNKREWEQRRGSGARRGDKEGEEEKQDDRTLAPQPSAKLQTGLLRWKAAVS